LEQVVESGSLERYLTHPKGWGLKDGLRSKKDQEAWKQEQFKLMAKAKTLAERALRQAEPGDEEVFSQADEANPTGLAELIAHELDHDEWLDDETHWVWEVAMDVATKWDKAHGWK